MFDPNLTPPLRDLSPMLLAQLEQDWPVTYCYDTN